MSANRSLVFFDDRHFTLNGSKRTMLAVAEAADASGHPVLVVSTDEGAFLAKARSLGLETAIVPLPASLDVYGGQLADSRSPRVAIDWLQAAWRLGKICKAFGADAVMVNSVRSALYCPVLPLRRIPVVWYVQIARSYGLRSYLAGTIPAALPMISTAVAVSAGLPEDHPVHLVPLGIDLSRFRAAASGREKSERIISIGSIESRKGHLDAIRAVSLAQKALGRTLPLDVVGEVPAHEDRSYAEEMIRLAESEGVELALLGKRDDVPELLDSAGLLLHAAHVEGVPRVLIEAQAIGVPIVCTAAGGSRDVVVPERTGYLVQPGDIDGLAAGIVARFDDVGPAMEMARRGREHSERYALSSMQEAIVATMNGAKDSPLEFFRRCVVTLRNVIRR